MAFRIEVQFVNHLFILSLGDVLLLSFVHQALQVFSHALQQEHVTVLGSSHFAMHLPPELSGFHDGWCRSTKGPSFFQIKIPTYGFADIPQNDALPAAICCVTLFLNILQPFQVAQVNAVEPVLA